MKTEKIVKELPTVEGKIIEVCVRYQLGGMNYFTGAVEQRGYFIGVTPFTHEGNMKSFSMFSGNKSLLMAANRFSQRILEKLDAPESEVERLLNKVLARNNLHLK
jgi:hypothetical protein